MFPLTVKPPSASTFHFSAPAQASKFLPSNNTIASDGGLLFSPGVTFGGSGQISPLRYRSPTARCTSTNRAAAASDATPSRFQDRIMAYVPSKLKDRIAVI